MDLQLYLVTHTYKYKCTHTHTYIYKLFGIHIFLLLLNYAIYFCPSCFQYVLCVPNSPIPLHFMSQKFYLCPILSINVLFVLLFFLRMKYDSDLKTFGRRVSNSILVKNNTYYRKKSNLVMLWYYIPRDILHFYTFTCPSA